MGKEIDAKGLELWMQRGSVFEAEQVTGYRMFITLAEIQ